MKTCLTISDFNVSNFNALLENSDEDPAVRALEAPFGQTAQLLLDRQAPCWQQQLEVVVVWTRPQGVIPSFSRVMAHEAVEMDELLKEVDQFASLLRSMEGSVPTVLIPTWVVPTYERGLGLLDYGGLLDGGHGVGVAQLLARMNLRLSESLAKSRGFYVLNAQRWVEKAGSRAFNPKLWYMSKTAFGNGVFKAAVQDVKAALSAVHGSSRKLILLDLDETLWGGIVGEVGWENLILGGHDPEGEALADFQAALKAMTNRGILLGIVSKNDEKVAIEAINQNPEMILKQDDFVGWRINWQDKAQNIADLVSQLNLGLQSVVFIDDNPAERARVQDALPQVLVPPWPEDKTLYRKTLMELTCFDSATLTEEDRERTSQYSTERLRQESKTDVGSLDDWLETLNVTVVIERLNENNLTRATQLCNKTNQMNLSTRRMTEAEFLAWASTDDRVAWTFRVTDKFGDMGLTGLLGLAVEGGQARIVDFILSCRVFGRKVEELMLATAIEYAQLLGISEVFAKYESTLKNGPCLDFFRRSGLRHDPDTDTFRWDTKMMYTHPRQIKRLEKRTP